MWLWKKFWNTDIIGKIYILIILFIVVVATITVITRYKNASTNQIENKQKNEIIGEDIRFESNVIDNNVTAVANIKEDAQEEIKEQNIKDITNQNIETKEQENSTIKTSSTLSSNKITQEETINKAIENQDKKDDVQENTKDEKNTNLEVTKEEIIQEPIKTVPIEEYKVNNDMINKMKNYILNNPSEDMKNYGFEVVVDTSITEQTNQFTYTEQRMRDKLNLRFGTIRIYALDYYCNGNLVMTECFIL
ncbi:MAG: hypothetical protein ACI4VP_00325 [Clostridia bacterium]